MAVALAAGRAAWRQSGDVPVGAVVLDPTGRIVAQAGNQREATGDPTAHAEIVALRRAAVQAGGWRLDGHTLVVTLEPCAMCAGAALAARLERVVYGADDAKAGAVVSLFDVLRDPRLPHRVEVTGGIRAQACAESLAEFFQPRRGRARSDGEGRGRLGFGGEKS
ncbi:MAG: tRNA adenosine(34) deaminase TadA [Propionibacteriaceae bacterium]|jgi:tRNA(adenine34) deaminase|nr:tRNA adenosine(34) deaminase TadA [Propionibacteriaceae bacterium]